MFYKDDTDLVTSSIVANRDMNRERALFGSNSYSKALRFDIKSYISRNYSSSFVWLDVCCGSGRALLQAYREFPQLRIRGIDLVAFQLPEIQSTPIQVHIGSILDFEFSEPFDLVTCVHGLHYLGDKLRVLTSLIGVIKPTGLLLANINLMDIYNANGKSLGRRLIKHLRTHSIRVDQRNRILSCWGHKTLSFPVCYLGSDDSVGANYTGQPAVQSVYSWVPPSNLDLATIQF